MTTLPNDRPCIRRIGDDRNRCGESEDWGIHKSAKVCTFNGGRCDYPEIHHKYEPGPKENGK
jgi:hypothetical protein